MTRQRFLKAMGTVRQMATAALALTLLGATNVHAEHQRVKIAFSGSAIATQIILQPGAGRAIEATGAGDGSLGPFTIHEVDANPPTPSGTCGGPNFLLFPVLPLGGSVLRFEDGSLLLVKTTVGGSVCVDVTEETVSITNHLQIVGGSGRFENASGSLVFQLSGSFLLVDPTGVPVLVAFTAKGTGTIALPKED